MISYPSIDIFDFFFFSLMFLVLRDGLDAKSIECILLGYPVLKEMQMFFIL